MMHNTNHALHNETVLLTSCETERQTVKLVRAMSSEYTERSDLLFHRHPADKHADIEHIYLYSIRKYLSVSIH
jgi:hypothetical protein